ncbi:radical SAM protein [Candidatus Bipolaricaulota bacterium]|nr:radical SAM protein [Candidatus Bipolaricaulota bacterium]
MIKEIVAKTLVTRVRGLDTYFGLDYGMNLYRGCQHHCIYCDSRSRCYEIENFDRDVLIKANAVERLRDELPRKRKRGIIGTGSMNDPYMPLEEQTELTRRALDTIADFGFGAHVITKSDLVLRDIPVLQRINRTHRAIVSLTVTTIDDELSKKLEPGAPASSVRFRALRRLSDAGIEARIALMPVLPFIEDTWENISAIIEEARRCGVRAIVAWFGMSMRDRQRDHFYARLDELFPELRTRYEEAFGRDYMCPAPRAEALFARFSACCAQHGISTSVQPHLLPDSKQLPLFG